jgi:hypothetical protein
MCDRCVRSCPASASPCWHCDDAPPALDITAGEPRYDDNGWPTNLLTVAVVCRELCTAQQRRIRTHWPTSVHYTAAGRRGQPCLALGGRAQGDNSSGPRQGIALVVARSPPCSTRAWTPRAYAMRPRARNTSMRSRTSSWVRAACHLARVLREAAGAAVSGCRTAGSRRGDGVCTAGGGMRASARMRTCVHACSARLLQAGSGSACAHVMLTGAARARLRHAVRPPPPLPPPPPAAPAGADLLQAACSRACRAWVAARAWGWAPRSRASSTLAGWQRAAQASNRCARARTHAAATPMFGAGGRALAVCGAVPRQAPACWQNP